MKITNKYGLPSSIVRAVENDGYNPGDSDITVTSLLQPPQIGVLSRKFGDDISEDAADRWFSLLGQAVHNILERADTTGITEERLYMDVLGWKVGGQFDRIVLEKGILQDYKVTSVWSVMDFMKNGMKDEWKWQLNMLRVLAMHNGYTDISGLQIVAMMRDWQKSKAKFDKSYPQQPIMVLDSPVERAPETIRFMEERVADHQRAREGDCRSCTADERWHQGDRYALMRKGRKTALRLLESPEAIMDYAVWKKLATSKGELIKDHYIEFRQGEYRRCMDYCPVSSVCPQWQSELYAVN